MEQSRLLLAIVISLLIFLAWQFFFAPTPPQQPAQKADTPAETQQHPDQAIEQVKPYTPESKPADLAAQPALKPAEAAAGRTITVETPLYEAKISENGGVK